MNGDHSLPADFRGILEECGYRAVEEDIEGAPEREKFRVISDQLGSFLFILSRATNRKRIIEINGPGGASSSVIWLAGAASQIDGEVFAGETNPRRLVKLQNCLSRARLSPNVGILDADPMWLIEDEQSEAEGKSLDPFDMVLVSLTENDWPRRVEKGWEILDVGGLMVLTDTIQANEAANEYFTTFINQRDSAVVPLRLGEGVILAYKLDHIELRSAIPDADFVGEKAADVLLRLQKENRTPGSNLWAIPPETGRFLWIVLRMMNAQNVLEIGSSGGYSGTWLASALKSNSGKLTTMDMDPEKIARAKDSYGRAGLLNRITILEGDALDIVPSLNEKFDLIFLDCDKDYYIDLLEPILYRIRRGGLLIADNVISHAEDLKSYLDEVKGHPGLASVTVPVGSGEEMTVML